MKHINEVDAFGRTALHRVAVQDNTQEVEALLKAKANVEALDNDHATPLHYAAVFGRTVTVKLLLDRGADVNAKDKDGITPLHYAALRGHAATVQTLMSRDADPIAEDNKKATPSQYAEQENHREIIDFISQGTQGILNLNFRSFSYLYANYSFISITSRQSKHRGRKNWRRIVSLGTRGLWLWCWSCQSSPKGGM